MASQERGITWLAAAALAALLIGASSAAESHQGGPPEPAGPALGSKGVPDAVGARSPAVRPLNSAAALLLAEARRRSPTVARLLAALDASDLVVLLDLRLMPRCQTGRLRFVSGNGTRRFVKVDVSATVRWDQAVGWLGHELQHAIEVASAPGVRDDGSLEGLYRRVGNPQLAMASTFETEEAIRVRARVLAEVFHTR
jgi:hypothetical protein